MCFQIERPKITIKNGKLEWVDISLARCYIIYKDGHAIEFTTQNNYDIINPGVYSVRGVNEFGGLGVSSVALDSNNPTGVIDRIENNIVIRRDGELLLIQGVTQETMLQVYSISGNLISKQRIFSNTTIPIPGVCNLIIQTITNDQNNVYRVY